MTGCCCFSVIVEICCCPAFDSSTSSPIYLRHSITYILACCLAMFRRMYPKCGDISHDGYSNKSRTNIYRIKSYEKARPKLDVPMDSIGIDHSHYIKFFVFLSFLSFFWWWGIVQSKQGVENSAVMMSTNLPHQGHHQPALTRRFERQQPGSYQDRWSTSCVYAAELLFLLLQLSLYFFVVVVVGDCCCSIIQTLPRVE